MDINESFEKHTEYTRVGGRHEVKCLSGFFAVSAGTKEDAMREARHYFIQYFSDGEYDRPRAHND